ncbi:MAG: hypothetical protein J7K11_08740 [Candidatus Hydrothermae bacterium]|nr:hypothetical protein [Candidatus Hydrothermae bacterium]
MSDVDFNESDVRDFHRLLNHRHLTELRFLKRGLFPAWKIVGNEDEFVEAARKWNGKRNVYAGLRDRRPDLKRPANMYDIVGLQLAVLDIDPVREPEVPSTGEELKRAEEMALRVADWFEEKGFLRPAIGMTGNGFALYFPVPYLEINDENRFDVADRLCEFERGVRKVFRGELNRLNCQIDSMYDLPRIGKVLGTLSVKGENTPERPWRLSKFYEKFTARREDSALLEAILNSNLTKDLF